MQSGPKRSRNTIPMTLKVPKRCLMRPDMERGADGIRFKTVLNSTEGRDFSYNELVS